MLEQLENQFSLMQQHQQQVGVTLELVAAEGATRLLVERSKLWTEATLPRELLQESVRQGDG